MPREDFEERRSARIDRLHERAAAKAAESSELWERSSRMASVIPMGQPILVGHHSEKRDRNYRAKIQNTAHRAIESDDYAKNLKNRAEAAEDNTSIFSDDPEAVVKLTERIEKATKLQETMKACNKVIKSKKLDRPQQIAKLMESTNLPEANIIKLFEPDFCGRIGFASYQLTNNNANINRMKKRLISLKNADTETKSKKYGDIELIYNIEANRVQLVFPSKPDDAIRTILKHHGFKWSRNESAWQRLLNRNGKYSADLVIKQISEFPGGIVQA